MSRLAGQSLALRRTALHQTHRDLGARMVDFAGWDMPVEYTGIVAEHIAVRTRAGLFDVSHMGEIEVDGPGALDLLQKVTSNDVSHLGTNQAQYSALLNDRGGMVDDLLVHKVADESYFLCVNAGRREADFQWICQNNQDGARVRDTSDRYTQLALQGPASIGILQPLTDVALQSLRYYWFARGSVCGVECLVARTGYTGEDGFEIYLPVAESESIWQALLAAGHEEGLIPCGLGARNTLRLEAGLLLYGNDMDEATTPLEVNLGWICKLGKGPFFGREVLARQAREGTGRTLAGFRMIDRAIARDHHTVVAAGRVIGRVTSGSHAPFLKQNIGFASLPPEFSRAGQRISVEIRTAKAEAEVTPVPFYRRKKTIVH